MSTNRPRPSADPPTPDERVYVLGGEQVGYRIAYQLAHDGFTVHTIDRSIPADLPDGMTGAETPSLDAAALAESEVDRATVVVVAGDDDAENLLLSQLARTRFDVERIVTLVNDPRRTDAFESLGVEVVDVSAVLGEAVSEQW